MAVNVNDPAPSGGANTRKKLTARVKGGGKRAPVAGVEETIGKLEKAERDRIADLEARIRKLGRATTDHTFILGEHLDAAASILEDQPWAEWVKSRFEMTDRHARNIRNVHRNLGHVRDACVRLEIKPTVLYHLVSADREIVDTVIAAFERGERLKVREVKALVDGADGNGKDDGEAAAAPGDRGGMKDLKGLAAAKQARQIKSLRKALAVIDKEIEAALEPTSRGKRVVKGKLADAVMMTARLAERELTELILDIEPESIGGSQSMRHVDAPGTRWSGVLSVLYKMGAPVEYWPKNEALTPWLTDEVLPLIAFALGGDNGKPTKAEAEAGPNEEAEAAAGTVAAEATASDEPEGSADAVTEDPATPVAETEPVAIDPEAASDGEALTEEEAATDGKAETAEPKGPSRKPRAPKAEAVEAPATDAAAEAEPDGKAIRREHGDAGDADSSQTNADEVSDLAAASVDAEPVSGSAD